MSDPAPARAGVALRPAGEVMTMARMGAAHPTRLSFLRVMLRRLHAGGWRFHRPLFDLDARGVGLARYQMDGPDRSYTLVAFSHDIPDAARSDRVIAERWDATFALYDGVPGAGDVARLHANVPLQEAGRVTERELVLSRANRSGRLFQASVDDLARGRQPDRAALAGTGYLMRTTAVYGSGKFGAADYSIWGDRPEFRGSFQPEMLSVWLIRAFTVDLVEHLARARGGAAAVPLAPDIRRMVGVGNATGLGMAPFLIGHPRLIHAWVAARETALARVRSQDRAADAAPLAFEAALARAEQTVGEWRTATPELEAARLSLLDDLNRVRRAVPRHDWTGPAPWDALWHWGEGALGVEGQEMLLGLMLEPHGALVDVLAETMRADETVLPPVDGAMSVGRLREKMERDYGWALGTDFDAPEAIARTWYVSEEKLEPRLGERAEEALEPFELPLAPGRAVHALNRALAGAGRDTPIARILLQRPELRGAVRRVQLTARHAYAEVRDNTIGAAMRPVDLLRCKLAFFGASKFDPRSDRWLRITLFQGAPYPEEIASVDPDAAFLGAP